MKCSNYVLEMEEEAYRIIHSIRLMLDYFEAQGEINLSDDDLVLVVGMSRHRLPAGVFERVISEWKENGSCRMPCKSKLKSNGYIRSCYPQS